MPDVRCARFRRVQRMRKGYERQGRGHGRGKTHRAGGHHVEAQMGVPQAGIRTCDLPLRRRMLCPLSYRGHVFWRKYRSSDKNLAQWKPNSSVTQVWPLLPTKSKHVLDRRLEM